MPRTTGSIGGILVLIAVAVGSGCSGTAVPPPEAGGPTIDSDTSLAENRDPAALETGPVAAPSLFPRDYRVYPASRQPEEIPVSGYDLTHTTLEITPNFRQRSVEGFVRHDLVVTAESLDVVRLHAFGLTVRTAAVMVGNDAYEAGWSHSGQELLIQPPNSLQAGDSVQVELAYTASPHRTAPRKGFVFVDPDGTEPSLPTQIWTLGQPEDNRMWFPTWDYPNDRMTFELSITVPDSLQTIANGVLIDIDAKPDGLRTDRWLLDTPQPAYLIALAAGDYVETTDEYVSPVGKTVPLSYYTEPEYANMADVIFGLSPDVMEVIERKTAVAYPFTNLKQVAVREFTAGGMENSTLVLYHNRLQHDERAHLDYTGRDLIAHEIAHQWFGDLITSASWGHLALNEGFATFFEQVYLEEAVGPDEAQEHRIKDRRKYLEEAMRFRRPIIWTDYADPNLLFDSHAYEKTELVLNALRFEIGDDAFWRGVRLYVSSSDDGTVGLAHLKEAMERSVRRPLTNFFDQWFIQPGHPELIVDHGYDETLGVYQVRVQQVQDTSLFPVFTLEAVIEVNYRDRPPYEERIRLSSVDTTYRFGVAGDVSFVKFDDGDLILADIVQRKSVEQWSEQALDDEEMGGRYDAVRALLKQDPTPGVMRILLETAEHDPYDFVRQAALTALERYRSAPDVVLLARRSALEDESARCRRAAIRLLASTRDASARSVIHHALRDSSYYVVAEAVAAVGRFSPTRYMDAFEPILDLRSWQNIVEIAILNVISDNPDPRAEDYVLRQLGAWNPPELRVAATQALFSFSRLGRDWYERVKTRLQRMDHDADPSVRAQAELLLNLL